MKKEAVLWEKTGNGGVHCFLCAQHCRIREGAFGLCGVRRNEGGELFTLVYADAIAAHVDPIEKKPLSHFMPGTHTYSIATIGCNFRCGFCQNWQISQVSMRDSEGAVGTHLPPERVVEQAKRYGCRSISYTYTEPTIFMEYAYDTMELAHREGLRNVFVTNGFMTPEALELVAPYLDAANVDLKSFRDEYYRRVCSGRLQPVLETIRGMKERNIHVEVTTLVVPGDNDSLEELEDIARFIAEVDPGIPWHLSRFHPDYRYTSQPQTPVDTLRRARDAGSRLGLRHIHLGNV